jgi:hypothetical protein
MNDLHELIYHDLNPYTRQKLNNVLYILTTGCKWISEGPEDLYSCNYYFLGELTRQAVECRSKRNQCEHCANNYNLLCRAVNCMCKKGHILIEID